jgi:hypothetical protein
MMTDPHTCMMTIKPKGFLTETGIISNIASKALPYYINGSEPRSRLGLWITQKGKERLKRFTTLSSFEKSVLGQFGELPKTIDEVVKETELDIDRVDTALRHLVRLEYLSGYGYYDIFNSKNYTNLQPSLKQASAGKAV